MPPLKSRCWWDLPVLLRTLVGVVGHPIIRLAARSNDRFIARDPDRALRMAEDNLARLIRLFGPDGGPTQNGRRDVALCLEALGRFTEARLLRESVLDSFRRHWGDEHLHTVAAEEWLAHNLAHSTRLDEAKQLLDHVYGVRCHALGPDHPTTVRVLHRLSEVRPDPNTEG